MKIKALPLDTRLTKAGPDDDLAEGEFVVYPATFIRQADAYGDVVAKGAFLDDIQRWKDSGNVMPGLFGHRMDDPDFYIASAHDMGEDEHGWWVRGSFDLEDAKAAKVYRLVKGRRISQMSFAYDVLDSGTVVLDDGDEANELRRLKVYEFSFVPIGANQDTSIVAIKSATEALAIKAGRVLSAKNEDALREVRDQISEAVKGLTTVLKSVEMTDASEQDQEKASGSIDAKAEASAEDPQGKASADVEELKSVPSVDDLATHIHLLALVG